MLTEKRLIYFSLESLYGDERKEGDFFLKHKLHHGVY